jgi:hypothetical protein
MWKEDTECCIKEYEFKSFPKAVSFIINVTDLAFDTELKSLWEQKTHTTKVTVRKKENLSPEKLMKKIDNIYIQG